MVREAFCCGVREYHALFISVDTLTEVFLRICIISVKLGFQSELRISREFRLDLEFIMKLNGDVFLTTNFLGR